MSLRCQPRSSAQWRFGATRRSRSGEYVPITNDASIIRPGRAATYSGTGLPCPSNVSVHPDPRLQAVVEQGREAEMVQAIDRLRLIHNEKRKTVYILCSIPLDIPINELVTWKQLIGDRRLSDGPRRRPPSVGGQRTPQRLIRLQLGFGVFLILTVRPARPAGPRPWCGSEGPPRVASGAPDPH
jgi:hypothetical protein